MNNPVLRKSYLDKFDPSKKIFAEAWNGNIVLYDTGRQNDAFTREHFAKKSDEEAH